MHNTNTNAVRHMLIGAAIVLAVCAGLILAKEARAYNQAMGSGITLLMTVHHTPVQVTSYNQRCNVTLINEHAEPVRVGYKSPDGGILPGNTGVALCNPVVAPCVAAYLSEDAIPSLLWAKSVSADAGVEMTWHLSGSCGSGS